MRVRCRLFRLISLVLFGFIVILMASKTAHCRESLIKHLLKHKEDSKCSYLNIDLEKASALLKAGADPNEIDKKTGITALIYATMSRDSDSPKFMELLLEFGADPNIKAKKYFEVEKYSPIKISEGATALTNAILCALDKDTHSDLRNRCHDKIKLLLRARANANLCIGKYNTPLTLSIENKAFDIAMLLLLGSADPNFKRGRTAALTLAVDKGQSELVKKLLDLGADPNVEGLKLASTGEGLKVTMTPNGSTTSLNMRPETVLELARREYRQDIVEMLIQAGAREHGQK